jgi:ribonuclease HII
VSILIDKHGGRNTYTAILQNAVPESFVLAREERMDRSAYELLGLQRQVTVDIQPRADAEHFCVALASMVSKYVRELLMSEFNGFWQGQLPGLSPTAGYPGDASRFYEAIRPAVTRLGIPEPALWRRK